MTTICASPECSEALTRKRYNGVLESNHTFRRRKYCDRRCMADGMRQETVTRAGYQERARAFRAGSCAACGATESLDVHHKDRDWSNNDPSNLETLCHSCHMRLHHEAGEIVQRKPKPPCSICGKPSYRRALCSTHLTRWKRHGHPLAKKIWDGSSWTLTLVER